MDRQLQHFKSRRFYENLSKQVQDGLGDRPCNPRLVKSFDRLVRQVLPPSQVQRFMGYSWHGRITYRDLLAKANQLRVVTGTRVTAAVSVHEAAESVVEPLVTFLGTASAASITFLTSAHFVVVMRQFVA